MVTKTPKVPSGSKKITTTVPVSARPTSTKTPSSAAKIPKISKAIRTKLDANVFYEVKDTAQLIAAPTDLKNLLETMPSGGMGERQLLDWFGESPERIAMLVAGLFRGGDIPTHVAREAGVHRFRADFACLVLPPEKDEAPRLYLIELQGALRDSVFKRGTRAVPVWSDDFLSGFSQLVDWHHFREDIRTWPLITQITKHHTLSTEVEYILIAGLEDDVNDALSRERLSHWNAQVMVGNNTEFSTLDSLIRRSQRLYKNYGYLSSI